MDFTMKCPLRPVPHFQTDVVAITMKHQKGAGLKQPRTASQVQATKGHSFNSNSLVYASISASNFAGK